MENDPFPKKKIEDDIIQYSNTYFRKHLTIPTILQLKTYINKKHKQKVTTDFVKRVRNKLPMITKYHPLGDQGKHRNHAFAMLKVSSLGWIEVDIMFITIYGKDYKGACFVAIDILSKRIFIHPISDKTLLSLKGAIDELIKSPGFTTTKCILSDQEAALKGLAKRKIYSGIKFIATNKKAKTVERAIRTLKLVLSKYMMAKGENSLYRWKNYINDVVEHLNKKILPGKIPGEAEIVRPIDLNVKNVGKYVNYMLFHNPNFFQSLHPLITPKKNSERLFKFEIGDKVYIAKKEWQDRLIQKHFWGETKSLAGHFKYKFDNIRDHETYRKDLAFVVKNRWLDISRTGHVVPVYSIENEDEEDIDHIYETFLRDFPENN